MVHDYSKSKFHHLTITKPPTVFNHTNSGTVIRYLSKHLIQIVPLSYSRSPLLEVHVVVNRVNFAG